MKYTYLYQDKSNRNCSGEIEARNRADAYARIRKTGIRPYRVIGEDPYDWRPLIFWGAISIATLMVLASIIFFIMESRGKAGPTLVLSPEEAAAFRRTAECAVYDAPKIYQYNVWRGVNDRLRERGLDPIPRPEGMVEEDAVLIPKLDE